MIDFRKALAPLAALALAGAVSGCVIHDRGATVILEWDFAGGTCEQAGVSVVRIELEDLDGLFYDSFEAPCAAGGVVVEDLTPGIYFLHVDGYGSSAFIWHVFAEVELHGGENHLIAHLEPIRTH